MADYDYKAGKKRIEEILDNKLEVVEKAKIPNDDNFTYSNAYYGWVTAIFVDIRDSSTLFAQDDKEVVSKMIRSFTSEIIEILRKDEENVLRDIGIRGDCVYAIYTTPYKDDTFEAFEKVIFINTFFNMLNKLLNNKGYTSINAGIGIATSEELVIKAGRKGVGISDSVWIGEAVTKASSLSSLGKKNGKEAICLSSVTYSNIIDKLKENNKDKKVEDWFTYNSSDDYGYYYCASIIKTHFDNWIEDGMKD